MTRPVFGDRVRIVAASETEASGFAVRIGEVWSESDPSASDLGPVIGDRGGDTALSVLFESTEDVVWFAPHLLERVERLQFPSRRLLFAFFLALSCGAVMAFADIGRSTVHRLTLISAATPCLPVQGYVTSGTYPNVAGASNDARTNIALRRALVTDQRGYARSAKQHQMPNRVGAYQTTIDERLTSASSVVVSALIPTLKLYPGRSGGGQTWTSATIDVRSGRPVSLRQVLASAPLALPALLSAWNMHVQSTAMTSSGQEITSSAPSFAHYRHFALTPTGLAFGFVQERSGSRSAIVIPYRIVRPYLSPLGRRLVSGVRRPRSTPRHDQHSFTWASFQHSHADPTANVPMTCT